MINITGCRIKKKFQKTQKKIFFQKQQKTKKNFFDVTMLLILVNYSSSNPKSLIN